MKNIIILFGLLITTGVQAQQSSVQFGTVLDVNQVVVQDRQQHNNSIRAYANVGTALGSVVGGLVGREVGSSHIGTAVGIGAGALIGNEVYGYMNEAKEKNGVEVLVKLEDGKIVAVKQVGVPDDFIVGSKVYVVNGSDGVRVRKSNQ